MAKNKNSKRGNLKKGKGKKKTGKYFTKRVSTSSNTLVENPFELRINKRKHDNLGRRGRNEQGVPGISRGRAVEKRKATLLQEYKVRNKSNSFLDNRIGEKRKEMPEEEKIIRRSAAEKARQFKKKSIFNLQDSEDHLTHRGKPLIDIDRYEDPRDASDSEEERLDADFVCEANFGGFMKMKTTSEQNFVEVDDNGQPKSHKQIIQELIVESKKKKYEKAKEADENYELVCKLDDDFKNPDIRSLLLMGGKDATLPNSEVTLPTEKQDYDKLVKELQFETKTGKATDRLKTDEEVAQEEKENLEQLEKERLKRMQMTDSDGCSKHRSADDLDDGFQVEQVEKEDSGPSDNENDEEQDSESDSYSDVQSEVGDGDDYENEDEIIVAADNALESNLENISADEKISEIPFVIVIPMKYKDFESMLKKYNAHYKTKKSSTSSLDIILSRMIKYNKVSDRTRLPKLFNYVVRYLLDMAEKLKRLSETVFKTLAIALPHLHALLVLNPNGCIIEVENGEVFDDFYPMKDLPVQKLLYFKICCQLFSGTDFHHKVLSSLKVKLLQALSQTRCNDIKLLTKVLFIVKLIYKLSQESRRYSPEIINVLTSIVQCYNGNEIRWAGFAIPTIRPAKSFLYISADECSVKSDVGDISEFLNDDAKVAISNCQAKLAILNVVLMYTQKFASVYERIPSSIEIFHPMKKALLELQTKIFWPSKISSKIANILECISNLKGKKDVLVVQIANRPKPLKLYEPLIEEDFDGMRKKKAPKGKQETSRLAHKVKQEMKNAVREIRKDTAFLAKQQLREQLEKDTDRKRKVKELLSSLANQEGEYQKSQKYKKK